MDSDKKQYVVMQPGPLHLFRTTGIFYLWSLKDRFYFILIVPEDYRYQTDFEKVAAMQQIHHVVYFQQPRKLGNHYSFSNKMRTILEEYKPGYILLHNQSYIENQYLLYWAKKIVPHAKRFFYQNGRMQLNWKEDFKLRRAVRIERTGERLPMLKKYPIVISKIYDIAATTYYYMHYKAIPLFLIRSTVTPPINVFSGKINYDAISKIGNSSNDFLITYLNIESAAYYAQGYKNILQIKHPSSYTITGVSNFLYGRVEEENSILLLPSYGFTSRMAEIGWKKEEIIDHVVVKWCEAIKKLLETFGSYSLKMKLHPASLSDPVWNQIVNLISLNFPAVEIIDPVDSAERHVLASKVIVGDVTTVLWWAGMMGGKTVISLDIFDYPGGSEMSFYKDLVEYIKDLEEMGIPRETDRTERELESLFPWSKR